MRYCDAKAMMESHGLIIGSVMASEIADTCNAYIYKQNPERFDEEKKFQYIRTGQTMDVWLQAEKLYPTVLLQLHPIYNLNNHL
ncbi:MAG: hypothetical protein WDO71_19775 [Bacteroidota bacterium]